MALEIVRAQGGPKSKQIPGKKKAFWAITVHSYWAMAQKMNAMINKSLSSICIAIYLGRRSFNLIQKIHIDLTII